MELNFEVISEVGTGEYPDVVHFANTQAQVFNIKEGELYAMPSDKIENGEWQNTIFQDELEASPDSGMSHFELKVLPGWGIIGGYKSGDIHKMIIYEFAWEMDRYLNNGSIKHSIDNPISSFTLNLENPDLKDPEHPGNVAINEENSLLSPGAKVQFKFGVGEEESEFEMGTFYVDRSNFQLLSETASADGRNSIGKILKEQTLDEKHEYWLDYISVILQDVFENGNIERDKYLIENTSKKYWFNFTPNTTLYNVLEQVFQVLPDWKVRELTDGTIVVGSDNYSGFSSQGHYVFYRDKDIFSRQIIRDDAEVYKRICVHTESFGVAIYREIETYTGWSLEANKTMYIQVSDDSKGDEVEAYADEIAARLDNVGKVESFVGPFRPHLQVGDLATIVGDTGSNNLGSITEITHVFGKSGYHTNFTVDSGGRLGKGLLSDYIKIIAGVGSNKSTSKGDSGIDRDDYRNIAGSAEVIVSSSYNSALAGKELINDGKIEDDKYPETFFARGWEHASTDTQPWFILDFKQRVLIDKIDFYFGWKPTYYDGVPTWYKVQYWNSSFWVDLIEEDGGIENHMSHSFTEIETSKIRVLVKRVTRRVIVIEAEAYGYM